MVIGSPIFCTNSRYVSIVTREIVHDTWLDQHYIKKQSPKHRASSHITRWQGEMWPQMSQAAQSYTEWIAD